MKAYQDNRLESLQEFTEPWGKRGMVYNTLGICCKIIGDDSGHTDPLTQELARILSRTLAEQVLQEYETRA